MPKIEKKKSFPFFPETFLAGTNYLTDFEVGVYWRMCSRIWVFQTDQHSFVDDDDNWMFLTNLSDLTLIKALRKKFTMKSRELFRRKKGKASNKLYQNGLLKARAKIADLSRQNALNARSRYIKEAYNKMEEERTQESRNDSALPINLAYLNKIVKDDDAKNIEKVKEKVTKKNKNINYAQIDNIVQILAKYLNSDQVEKIIDLMPEISIQYIMEKIDITREKEPKSISGFLYAAIINDYKPSPKTIQKKSSFLDIAKKRPLIQGEYDLLSSEEKKLFSQNEHIIPGGFHYKYVKKPEGNINIKDRFVFDTLEIGDDISKNDYMKLKKSNVLLASCFLRVAFSPKPIKVWNLKK